MPSYTVRRAPATPEFIGNWDGPVWSAAETAQVASFHPKGSDHRPATAVKALYDDRDISAGIKFKDADLIGIPVKVIIGEKNAKLGMIEVKDRKTGKVDLIKSEELANHIKSILK